MSFEVVWDTAAEAELATIWIGAPDRSVVTLSAHFLEQQLQQDPLEFGESRAGNRRIAFRTPLGLLYSVDSVEQVVRVIHVWSYNTR